jgi:hypothetical protein
MVSASPLRFRLGCLVLSALAGVLLGLFSIAIIIAIRGRDPSRELTREDFEIAQQRWTRSGPASYDISIKVVGRQPALYQVQVRSGDVVSATIDGRPLKQRRTFDTWSVPGMFGTIERDLEHVEEFTASGPRPNLPRLTLRATFDSNYGFPRRYRRLEWGTDRDVIWEVREFKVADQPGP